LADVATVRERGEATRSLIPKGWGGPLLVAPMAFWMIAFFLVPLILILLYSFGQLPGPYENGVRLGFDLEWYKQIISGAVYHKAFLLTAQMVVTNTLGCLILGYPLAYFISRKTGKRKTVFVLLVMLPFWTSFLIRAYAWLTILSNGGLLNTLLLKLHLMGSNTPMNIMFTNKSVIAGLIYDYLPFMVLPLFVSIEKIDRSLFEASKDLGAGKWVTFWRVTLPLSMPGIFAGSMLVAIPTTGEFVIPYILGGSKVVLWGWLIEQAFAEAGQNWAMGSALSNVLLVVMLIVVALYLKAVGSEEF
jgi:spermidine/putrescine transport system permease protein